MEIYPEQFPDESQPDPSHRSEDRVFDPIQDSGGPGSSNHEGQQDPEAPEMDFILSLPGVGRFGLQVKDIRWSLNRGSGTWKP